LPIVANVHAAGDATLPLIICLPIDVAFDVVTRNIDATVHATLSPFASMPPFTSMMIYMMLIRYFMPLDYAIYDYAFDAAGVRAAKECARVMPQDEMPA